jgi:hypothetical protein
MKKASFNCSINFHVCSGVGDESNQSFDVKGTFEHTIRIVK